MKRTWFALFLMTATAAHTAEPAENVRAPFAEDEAAIAAVKNLGAVVKRDDKQPGSPVVEVNLTFYGPVGVTELLPVARFQKLRTLKVKITRLTPPMVDQLRSLKAPKTLTLNIANCSELDLKALTQLSALEELRLSGEAVTDSVLKRVAGLASDSATLPRAGGTGLGAMRREASLPHLKALHLDGTSVTDPGLQQLADMRGLERLGLYYNKNVTEAGLRQLARFKQLKGLSLEQPGLVTDVTLTELTALTALDDLQLYETRITDAGMKDVARFKRLREFSLDASDVSEAGLMELVALEKLNRVFVFPHSPPVGHTTEEAIDRLKQALNGRAEVVSVVASIRQEPCD